MAHGAVVSTVDSLQEGLILDQGVEFAFSLCVGFSSTTDKYARISISNLDQGTGKKTWSRCVDASYSSRPLIFTHSVCVCACGTHQYHDGLKSVQYLCDKVLLNKKKTENKY